MANRKVTKETVKEVIDDIKYFYGIILTEAQVCYLFLNYRGVRGDWNRVGDVDTVLREKVLDAITKDCGIKKGWPLAGETEKVKANFEKRFKKAAKEKGYQLEGNWGMA